METAFTPGPWDFAPGINEYGREGGPILGSITKDGTWHLAVLPSDLGKEGDANARLIAAAPELYEAVDACRAAVASLEVDALGWGEGPHPTLGTNRWPLRDELLSLLDNTLAKARGEQ